MEVSGIGEGRPHSVGSTHYGNLLSDAGWVHSLATGGAIPKPDGLEMAHSWPPATGDTAEILAITRPDPELQQVP